MASGSNTDKMGRYFGTTGQYWTVSTEADLDRARAGDWLAIDWDDNGSRDHSAMFLGKYRDDSGTLRAITIEGNLSNRIKVKLGRGLDVIIGLGHVTEATLDNPPDLFWMTCD